MLYHCSIVLFYLQDDTNGFIRFTIMYLSGEYFLIKIHWKSIVHSVIGSFILIL